MGSSAQNKIFLTILLRLTQCEGHSRLAQQILDSSIVMNPGLFNRPSTREEVGAPASQADSFAERNIGFWRGPLGWGCRLPGVVGEKRTVRPSKLVIETTTQNGNGVWSSRRIRRNPASGSGRLGRVPATLTLRPSVLQFGRDGRVVRNRSITSFRFWLYGAAQENEKVISSGPARAILRPEPQRPQEL